MRRTIITTIVAAVAAATLAACSGGTDTSQPGDDDGTLPGAPSGGASSSRTAPGEAGSPDEGAAPYDTRSDGTGAGPDGAGTADLGTSDTSLGTVVVDGRGMTVYFFDSDTPGSGASTCTDACAAAWPAVETDSDSPTVEGVTGEVGVITGVDGAHQVTLDGRPLYTYAQDMAPGDVNGQGVGGVWWVVAPDGSETDH